MRRSRHKLQVSTFPFLAVLLATMGALILLLLVMDRRSKVVARNRALAAHAELVAARTKIQNHDVQDDEAARAAARAEWERRRQELHDLLREQEKELTQERDNLATKLTALSQDLGKEQQGLLNLEKTILEERARLDVKGQLLAQMRQGIAQTAQRDDQSKLEVEKLARDLAQLERALQEAKALKVQEKETFSLVPYRGKLGEGRRPVYVECTSLGLIFHPEERRLDNGDFDTQVFRTEIQRRGVDLVKEKRDPSRPPLPKIRVNPYVLFLIRPDGLESYYNAVSALRAFDLDFGYEFIDAQWALNFSGPTGFGGQIPPLADIPSLKPGTSRVASARQDLPPPPPLVGPSGYGPGSGGSGPGSMTNSGQYGGSGPYKSGYGSPTGSGTSPGDGLPPPYPPPTPGNPGQGYPFAGLAGNNGPRLGPIAGVNPVAGVGSGQAGFGLPPGVNPGGSAFPGSSPGAGSNQNNSSQGNNQSGPPGATNPGGGTVGQATGSFQNVRGNQGNPTQGNNQGGPPGPGNPEGGTTGQGSGDSKDVPWRESQNASAQKPGSSGNEGTAQGNGATNAKGNGGSAGDPGPMDPLARLASRTPFDDSLPGPKRPAPAPSVGRLLANRDYLLTVECFGDVVALYPSGQVFSMAQGADQKKLDEALVRSVLQLIARRQVTVRPGETPYRPMVRFQIHPEAMRTYFHVYPLFENLHIPLTRENLDS